MTTINNIKKIGIDYTATTLVEPFITAIANSRDTADGLEFTVNSDGYILDLNDSPTSQKFCEPFKTEADVVNQTITDNLVFNKISFTGPLTEENVYSNLVNASVLSLEQKQSYSSKTYEQFSYNVDDEKKLINHYILNAEDSEKDSYNLTYAKTLNGNLDQNLLITKDSILEYLERYAEKFAVLHQDIISRIINDQRSLFFASSEYSRLGFNAKKYYFSYNYIKYIKSAESGDRPEESIFDLFVKTKRTNILMNILQDFTNSKSLKYSVSYAIPEITGKNLEFKEYKNEIYGNYSSITADSIANNFENINNGIYFGADISRLDSLSADAINILISNKLHISEPESYDFLKNNKDYTQIIGYNLEKYKVNLNTGRSDSLQSFYFLNDKTDTMEYLDTQIKPNEYYAYKINFLIISKKYDFSIKYKALDYTPKLRVEKARIYRENRDITIVPNVTFKAGSIARILFTISNPGFADITGPLTFNLEVRTQNVVWRNDLTKPYANTPVKFTYENGCLAAQQCLTADNKKDAVLYIQAQDNFNSEVIELRLTTIKDGGGKDYPSIELKLPQLGKGCEDIPDCEDTSIVEEPTESGEISKAVFKIKYLNGSPILLKVQTPATSFLAAPPILAKRPIPPFVDFIPYQNVQDKITIAFTKGLGKVKEKFKPIEPSDIASEDLVDFETSEKNDEIYKIYRLDYEPSRLTDFGTRLHAEIDSSQEVAFMDELENNKKYYYLFRSEIIRGNTKLISNPSAIYEVELVKNSGIFYPVIRLYEVKSAQLYKPTDSFQKKLSFTSKFNEFRNQEYLFGLGSENTVYNKFFKLRVTSKKSGRKIDINFRFSTQEEAIQITDYLDDLLNSGYVIL